MGAARATLSYLYYFYGKGRSKKSGADEFQNFYPYPRRAKQDIRAFLSNASSYFLRVFRKLLQKPSTNRRSRHSRIDVFLDNALTRPENLFHRGNPLTCGLLKLPLNS